MRHVDRNELDAGLLEAKQKVGVAAQPIEATNDGRGVEDAAGVEGQGQRRTVVGALAALDLDELFDQLPTAAVEPAFDSGALRLEAGLRGAEGEGRSAGL